VDHKVDVLERYVTKIWHKKPALALMKKSLKRGGKRQGITADRLRS
jgi:hypothetical protein